MTTSAPEIRSYDNQGFQLTFANGWTISVMFGPGHYCEHRNMPRSQSLIRASTPSEHKSKDADVSIWDAKGETLRLSADLSAGWTSPDKVARLMMFTHALSIECSAADFNNSEDCRRNLADMLREAPKKEIHPGNQRDAEWSFPK